jgi:hypothetical protein
VKHSVALAMACSAMAFSFFFSASRSNAVASAAPTPVPYTMPDFSSMKMFLGTWTCDQTVRGKTRPDTSTTTMGLDGQYMVSHDVAPPFDKYRSKPVVGDSYTTYNSNSHLWVTVGVDSFGGYSVSTSPGWVGNTMSTKTEMTNDGSTGSDVLTKISDTKTSDASVSTDPQGNVTHATITCTKSDQG